MRLVVVGLLVAFVGGQLEGAAKRHHAALGAASVNVLGIIADALAVVVIAGLVMLVSYLRTGHPVPGRARPRAVVVPKRRYVAALETSAEMVKLADGVMAGPSVELAEAPEGAEVATLPGLSELQPAHLELAGKGAGGDKKE